MTSSGISHILVGYLSDDQKFQLAKDLSGNLKNDQNVVGLTEVLDSLDAKSVHHISRKVFDHLQELILNQRDLGEVDLLLLLLAKLPNIGEELFNWLYDCVSATVSPRLKYLFSKESIEILEKNDILLQSQSNDEVDLEYVFGFFEKVFGLETIEVPVKLDRLVLALLSINEESISKIVQKTLRWRVASFARNEQLLWDLIFCMLNSEYDFHVTNAFIQWLRFLTHLHKNSTESTIFTELIKDDQYWKYIQNGLVSSTHEQKKYSLSILKLSIQLTTTDLNNSLISFDLTKSNENIKQWKRFCTLYEIVGVDTALNQAEAAKGDLLQLLSPKSYIKPAWGLVLLCSGFKASMESVRRFALNLMFDVSKEDMSIFAHEFFTDVFLKCCIEASNFQVKRTENKLECPYGNKLEMFVENVLLSLKKEKEQLKVLVDGILELLVESTQIFAPARIYLTSGLLKGLRSQKILTEANLNQLYKMFDSSAEDISFERYLQSLHLLLLGHLEPNVPLLLNGLTQFVLFNGYSTLFANLETFLDYVSVHHNNQMNPIEFRTKSPEHQVVYFTLFGDCDSSSETFLKELAYSGFRDFEPTVLSSAFIKLLTKLITNPIDSSYKKSCGLVELEIFKNSWNSVSLSPLFLSVLNEDINEFNQDKLEFFDKVYAKYSEVSGNSDSSFKPSFEELMQLFNKLDAINLNFKLKDSIIGAYLNILLSSLRLSPLEESELSQVISVLQRSLKSGFHLTFIKICKILQHLFSNYEQIVDLISSIEILESIWDFINGDRLILNQKDMHLIFIETTFHPLLIKDTINNEFNAKTLKKIALDIISHSYTRRSLQPCLSKCLLQYSLGYKVEFQQTEWIIELLFKILTLIQDNSNLFRIKDVLCDQFDKEISFEGHLYEDVYGPAEISAKINIISIIASCSKKYAKEYFSAIVDNDPYHLITPKNRVDCDEELKRIYGFGSVLLIVKKLPVETLSKYVSELFMPLLETESSPLVKIYLEWIIAIDMIKSEKNRQSLLELFESHHKPALVTSVERIAILVCQQLKNDKSGYEFFENFTRYLIPNCASNKPLIRHFSNSLCLSLYPELKSKGIELTIEPVILKLYQDAKKSESTGKYRNGDALTWDVERDFNLTSIFGGVLKRISPRDINVFVTEEEFKKYLLIDDLDVEVGVFKGPNWERSDGGEKDEGEKTINPTLQTKSGAWEAVLDFDEQQRAVKRTDLIVVSSLVDKPPNLGGICRLCDVLGTGLMTVDDMRVTKHPQFKNVAVTADSWMPMTEVKIEDISDFMREKKKEGYTLIGLEQTDKSLVLGPSTRFPAKSLFLLGREAEGIPGELLAELDYCIEIRQRGVIRSMNIQTATAVLVHAYSSSVA